MYMCYVLFKYIYCFLISNYDCENFLFLILFKFNLILGIVFIILDFFVVIYVFIRNFEKVKLNI